MKFKSYLTEAYDSKRSVIEWLDNHGIETYVAAEIEVVQVGDKWIVNSNSQDRVKLSRLNLLKLPIKFGKVTGDFDIEKNRLISFDNFPDEILGSLDCSRNKLKSLEGCPKVYGHVAFFGNPITSFHDVHKHLQCNSEFYMNVEDIKDSILGFLLVKHLKKFIIVSITGDAITSSFDKELSGPFDILNKYLPNTRGKEAVFECQSELIEAGFEQFAKL